MNRAQATILAFDFGAKRIGVAVGQTVSRTASPLQTLTQNNGRPDWEAIGRLIDTWEPSLLLLGLPSHADGTPHRLAPAVQRFQRRLQGRFKLPVEFIDERLSSVEAAARGYGERDAVAAQVILETWLNDKSGDIKPHSKGSRD